MDSHQPPAPRYVGRDRETKRQIKVGEFVELTDGRKILLSSEDGGRLIVVQLVKN